MLYELRIRLLSPMLGADKSSQVRRFERGETEEWLRIGDVFSWAFHEAVASLKLKHDVNTHGVRLPLQLKRPTLILFRRNCRRGGKPAYDIYEAVNKNTILCADVFIPESVEGGRCGRVITPQEVRRVFEFVGAHIGISPWGSKFGFGRFRVESLELADVEQSLRELHARQFKLPHVFVEENLARASDIQIRGHSLTKLSRPELLALVAFMHNKQTHDESDPR